MVTRCTVIGDATLDVSVQSAAAARPGGDVPADIALGPGGQAANVAVRLARLGVAVTLAAPIADDAIGRWLAEVLHREGLELVRLPAARSSAVVILLGNTGERSMLSDRQPVPADGVAATPMAATWVHVSAYPLLDDRGGDDLATELRRRPSDSRLSVAGGSIPPDSERVARFRDRLAAARPDLLVVSLDEAAALIEGASPAAAGDAAAQLREAATVVVVTAGSRGSAAVTPSEAVDVPVSAPGGPMVDATGAGDAYLATLLHGLEPEPWPPDAWMLRAAMQRASRAGAQAARVMGAQARIALEDEPRVG